jgi:hypothetical protein
MRRDEYGRHGAEVWVSDHAILAVCLVVACWLVVVGAIAGSIQGLI